MEHGIADAAPLGRDAGDTIWTFSDGWPITQAVSICREGNSAWALQLLNDERMQRFELLGDGTPNFEVTDGESAAGCVQAAEEADLAVFLATDPQLVLTAYNSTSTEPLWTYTYPSNFTVSSTTYQGVAVSRDGSVVACYAKDADAGESEVRFFNSAGDTINTWTYEGTLTALDLTDDGSLCLVTQSSKGIVVDVATATEIFEAAGSGGGNTFHRISGDGSVIVLGGFRVEVYTWDGSTYNQVLRYSPGSSWFGRGVAVSRDSSTVAASCHVYTSYLETVTRIWDVETLTLLGEYTTTGEGSYQDTIDCVQISDDGSVFAAAFWGTQDNAHPEVMIFDRDVNLIGGIDTPGSVYALDLTGDGVYAMSGGKAVHANVTGRGCDVVLYQVLDEGCAGDVDGDGDTDLADLADLLTAYGSVSGDANWNADADFDGDDDVDLADLAYLLSDYGC